MHGVTPVAYFSSLHITLNIFGPCPKIGLSKNILKAVRIKLSCSGVKIDFFIVFVGLDIMRYFISLKLNVSTKTKIRDKTDNIIFNFKNFSVKIIINIYDKTKKKKSSPFT